MTATAAELTLAVDEAARAVAGVVYLYAAKPVPHVAKQMTSTLVPALEAAATPAGLSSVTVTDSVVEVLVSVGVTGGVVTGGVAEVVRSVAAAVRAALVAGGVDAGASEVHVRVSRVAASDLAAPGA